MHTLKYKIFIFSQLKSEAMKKHLLRLTFLSLLLSIPVTGFVQTQFSLVSKSQVLDEGSFEYITEGKDFETALEIYQNLAAARGDKRLPIPPFKMVDNVQNVAFLEGDGNSIGLEKKAYEICMSFGEKKGKSAIAALLGHELTHFYEKHQWRSGFAEAFKDLKVGEKLSEKNGLSKLAYETQADYLGGFLAYSAGYPVFDQMPALYDKLYKEYPLPEVMNGYPDLEERKELVSRSTELLKQLIDVFEMANLMVVLTKYEEARAFYKHNLTNYQSSEIYNNLGVLSIMEALNFFSETELPYRIPVELDLEFSASKFGAAESNEKRRKLLEEAIIYLQSATTMDKQYAPAYQNLACAYFLLEDYDRARFYAAVEARQKANSSEAFKKTALDADILLALIAERQGNKAEGLKILEDIKAESGTAAFNFLRMSGQPTEDTLPNEAFDDETIDGISAYDDLPVFVDNHYDSGQKQELYGVRGIDFIAFRGVGGLEKSTVYFCKPPRGEGLRKTTIHITDEGYTGTTRHQFKVGTDREAIVQKYGKPNSTRDTPTGEIVIYEYTLFIFDENKKLLRWANYL